MNFFQTFPLSSWTAAGRPAAYPWEAGLQWKISPGFFEGRAGPLASNNGKDNDRFLFSVQACPSIFCQACQELKTVKGFSWNWRPQFQRQDWSFTVTTPMQGRQFGEATILKIFYIRFLLSLTKKIEVFNPLGPRGMIIAIIHDQWLLWVKHISPYPIVSSSNILKSSLVLYPHYFCWLKSSVDEIYPVDHPHLRSISYVCMYIYMYM